VSDIRLAASARASKRSFCRCAHHASCSWRRRPVLTRRALEEVLTHQGTESMDLAVNGTILMRRCDDDTAVWLREACASAATMWMTSMLPECLERLERSGRRRGHRRPRSGMSGNRPVRRAAPALPTGLPLVLPGQGRPRTTRDRGIRAAPTTPNHAGEGRTRRAIAVRARVEHRRCQAMDAAAPRRRARTSRSTGSRRHPAIRGPSR